MANHRPFARPTSLADSGIAALSRSTYDQGVSTARDHASLYENPAQTHGFVPLRVEGQLPEGLAGTLYRCGPGLIERFGKRLPHPFEADGVVMGARLDGHGGAQGAVRIIEGPGYLEEQAAGRYLYGNGASWTRRVRNMLRGEVKNTGNTRAWTWGDRVFALMEAAKPLELDPATLEVLGERDLDGAVNRSFSAHPHRVESLATTFNFGQRYGRQTMLDLYAIPDRGKARLVGSVECGWAGMIHDFVVTERHAIFLNCPVKLAMGRALLQIGDLSEWFRWNPQMGTEVIVVPLDEPSAAKRFTVEGFWVWHFVNAFERSGEIIIDYCRYPDFDSLREIAGGITAAPPKLHRATLNPQTGSWNSEERWEVPCEFPRIAPRFEGREHPHTWLYTGDDSDEVHELARVDANTGAVDQWTPETGLRPSEPVPVPRSDQPDASPWILTLCHDTSSDKSCVAVLDGGAMHAGPVAKLWFDQTIPLTFHGSWAGA